MDYIIHKKNSPLLGRIIPNHKYIRREKISGTNRYKYIYKEDYKKSNLLKKIESKNTYLNSRKSNKNIITVKDLPIQVNSIKSKIKDALKKTKKVFNNVEKKVSDVFSKTLSKIESFVDSGKEKVKNILDNLFTVKKKSTVDKIEITIDRKQDNKERFKELPGYDAKEKLEKYDLYKDVKEYAKQIGFDISDETDLRVLAALVFTNPEYEQMSDIGTDVNCQMCTINAILRLQGYDVSAPGLYEEYWPIIYSEAYKNWKEWHPSKNIEDFINSKEAEIIIDAAYNDGEYGHYDNMQFIYDHWFEKANVETVDYWKYANADSRSMFISELQSYGDGAYGDLNLAWDDGGAHSVLWYNNDRSTYIVDTQTGNIFDISEISYNNYLSYAIDVNYTRLDNLEMKEDILEVVRVCQY